VELLHRSAPTAPDDESLHEIARDLLGDTSPGLTADNSTFTFRDVVRAWADVHVDGAAPARLEQLATWTLAQPGVREVDCTSHGAVYSTQALLDLESGLLREAQRRIEDQAAIVPTDLVEAAIRRRPTMTPEQAAMVRSLTTSGAGIELVKGYAGAGKTFALEAAREAWEAAGVVVVGAAIAGKAAAGLSAGSGIRSSTIARLMLDLSYDPRGLPTGGVLVVDEAGMVGTRVLHELAAHAARCRTKLVLVGDDAQLPELVAGGSFSALALEAPVSELVEVQRQQDSGDVELLARIRLGHADQALEALARSGRIVAGPTGELTRELLVRDWLRDEQALPGRGVIVVRSRDRIPEDPAPEELRRTPPEDEDPIAALGRAMSRSRAKTTATSVAEQAGSLRLADAAALSTELIGLEAELLVPATRVRRAETIERQLERDTDALRRLVELAEATDPSRAQRDAAAKLTHASGRRATIAINSVTSSRTASPCSASAIRGELHRREAITVSTSVRAAAANPPAHLFGALGSRPHTADERAAWDRGAQIIESYRHRFAPELTVEQHGLGPQPAAGAQRRAWYAFTDQLGPVLRQLRVAPNAPGDA